MSVMRELEAWLKECRPDLVMAMRMPVDAGLTLLNEATGLSITAAQFDAYGPEHICGLYLGAFKLSVEVIEAPAKPKKPPPALPLECWHSRAFDAESAHAATLALCRGN